MATLIKYPTPQKPNQLETKASDQASGAVPRIVMPDRYKLVAYKSLIFSNSEQNYPIHNKELFEIVHALKK